MKTLLPAAILSCLASCGPAPKDAPPAGGAKPQTQAAAPKDPPKDPPRGAPRAAAEVTRDLESVLDGVRDVASAQKARARLDELARELGDAVAKAEGASSSGSQGLIPEASKLANKVGASIDSTLQPTKVYQELKRIAGDGKLYGELKAPVDRLQELVKR